MPPTPEGLAKNNTEDGHQAAIFCHFALPHKQAEFPECAVLLFAIPNGGLRDKITAAKLKATGTKSGTLDMFLSVSRGGFHGCYVELKKIGVKKAKPEQVSFIMAARAEGYYATVAEGWIEAVEYIEGYLRLGR
jgi:hypothetical protein